MDWILIIGTCSLAVYVIILVANNIFKPRRGYAFWSDFSSDTIIRSYLNASERVVFVTGGMSCVCKSTIMRIISIIQGIYFSDDVAWDWINEKLYWTDLCASDVEVYDPTTTYRRVLFNSTTGVLNPHGIVVDPTTGYDSLKMTHKLFINILFQMVLLD